MSIRTNTNFRLRDESRRPIALPATLQDLLQRNGMHAQIVENGQNFALLVQGHDSPVLSYNLTRHQLQALTDFGTNHANKKAYNTFASIVANDFDLPRNYVHARNANGRVAMGLHGYRVGTGEPTNEARAEQARLGYALQGGGRPIGQYGRMPMDGYHTHRPHGWQAMDRGGFHHPFLGWTPRQQMGYHMRRIGDEAYFVGAPMTPVRPDGRIKPGELSAGGYGFYYKGGQQQQQAPQQIVDPLAQLQTVLPQVQVIERKPADTGIPYKEAITSDVYFSNEKWQEVLSSHGIIIDADKKSLTIQSSEVPADLNYNLKPDELKILIANDLKTASVQQRLDVINSVIGGDFADKITKEMLDGKQTLSINMKPEALAEVKQRLGIIEPQLQQLEQESIHAEQLQQAKTELPPLVEGASVHGKDLEMEATGKGWYREGAHGREVAVDEIRVEPVRSVPSAEESNRESKHPEGEVKYKMTAVINGEAISHEITQKQYNKFMALDDEHRMKLFAKVFPEVDIKKIPKEDRLPSEERDRGPRVPFGQKLLMALSVAGEATGMIRGMAHDVGHIRRDLSGSSPERYVEGHAEFPHSRGGIYYKPGVDTYNEVASRAFDAGMQAEYMHHELHHGM